MTPSRCLRKNIRGVKVQYTSGVLKDDYSEWLAEELMEENAPDVFFVLGDDFSSFVDAGALKELTSFMEEDTDFHTDAFYSSALACGARWRETVRPAL